jgi:hypothetical protein
MIAVAERKQYILIFGVFGLIVASLCIIGAALIFKDDIPEGLNTLCSLIVGTCLKAMSEVIGFEFGSSRSSQAKDTTIAALSKTQEPPPPEKGTKK